MNISEKKMTIKVPGKLFFAGEYSVTKEGNLALITTIETNFEVRISATTGKSIFKTNVGLSDFEFSLSKIEFTKENPWNFALTALKNTLSAPDSIEKNSVSKILSSSPEISLEIVSDLGFGENKKGYGSSASVVCGLVNAVNQFFDLQLSLEKRFEIAAKTHFEVQGSGSMGDIAAIMYGGSVFYQNHKRVIPLEIPWATFVVQTGKAAKTSEKIKIKLSDEFYQASNELVIELATAIDIQDFALFKEKLSENQLLLLENIPEGYMTKELAIALNLLNSYPEFAAKISGAGFGENIILFAQNTQAIAEVQNKLSEYGINLEKFKVAQKNN
ncbi:mevalonate kinase family protein [Lactococcus lactis]|uniref:mevalonate kinase family protein n=1 Tax=Lactococcus lactis TaxID=1358 RepID=UPI003D0DFBC4